jgi:hypothetical protein
MLFWWMGTDDIDFDAWVHGSTVLVALGVIATFVRYHRKRKVMQAIPTMPAWTPPADAPGNIAPIIEVEYKRLPN